MICYLYPELIYFFFSSEVPELLYYTHIPAAFIALLVGFFVFFKGKNLLLNQLLLLISVSFSVWTFINLTAWTNIEADIIAFIWPFFGILSAILSVLCVYFMYVFLYKRDVSILVKIVFLLLLLPVLLFAPTNLSISGFDITNCDAFAFEGLLYKFYYTFLGLLAIIWILILSILRYREVETLFKKQIILMSTGIQAFLLLFFSVTISVTYLVNAGILVDSRIEMYGLLGMVIFMVLIGISIVQFKTFDIKLLAPQALVISLLVLIGAQFAYLDLSTAGIILSSLTLIFTSIIGLIIIRNIKREIIHREKIEKLAKALAKANDRLKELDKQKSEFVSIASHQLRSPLTAISGYASLLKEGSYGKLPVKAEEPIERIYSSARAMSQSVEEYLNVSRIESGNMKYNMIDFNLRDEVEHVCDDLRPIALKKGLLLFFRTDTSKYTTINADKGKIIQAIHNLINNSIKYTEKGTITIYIHDSLINKRIYVEVIDTGIGMSEDTLSSIFHKFKRAENAHKVNIQGTGLGLYMALKIVQAMGGTITAHSEGEGKGSKFILELPFVV
jgi:signal transduction histidine kinase